MLYTKGIVLQSLAQWQLLGVRDGLEKVCHISLDSA